MNSFTKRTKGALLHRAAFAVLAVLCFETWAKTATQNRDTDALSAAKKQYEQALQGCSQSIAPAQCQRQARLDYATAKHQATLNQAALNIQAKRDQQAAKQQPKSVIASKEPVAGKQPPRPMSTVTASRREQTARQRMAAQNKPSKPITSKKAMAAQPAAAERSANVKAQANKTTIQKDRQVKVQEKTANRLAKDEARRAAGFTVDKEQANKKQ